ncbi:MAG: hypothetical protein JWN04_2447, partial [Myxococcaceae bacterium]|nr:hypothetical protein [Myxococcaceae bacterium]
RAATSTTQSPSIVRSMNHAAALLGFSELEAKE